MPNEIEPGVTLTTSELNPEKASAETTGESEEKEGFNLTQHLLETKEEPEKAETNDDGDKSVPSAEEEIAPESTENETEEVDEKATEPKEEIDDEPEVVDHENVLSKFDLSALSEETQADLLEHVNNLTPGLTKRLKQLDGQRKQAQEDLKEYKKTVEKPEVQVRYERENPFRHISDRTELNNSMNDWQGLKDDALLALNKGIHPEDIVHVITDDKGEKREFTKEYMEGVYKNAQENLRNHFPNQLRYLDQKNQYHSQTLQRFPWFKNKNSAEFLQLEKIKSAPSFAGIIQNHAAGEFLGAVLAKYVVEEAQKANGKKIAKKPPKSPASRISKPTRSSRIDPNTRSTKRAAAKVEFNKSGGSKQSLESFLKKTNE